METIGVSEQVKAELETLKEEKGHTSYDSTIRELLLHYEYSSPDSDVNMRHDGDD